MGCLGRAGRGLDYRPGRGSPKSEAGGLGCAAVLRPESLALVPLPGSRLALRGGLIKPDRAKVRSAAALVLLSVVCAALVLTYTMGQSGVGGPPPLSQALQNPAFYEGGRTEQLPFVDPINLAFKYAFSFLTPHQDAAGGFLSTGTIYNLRKIIAYIILPLVLIVL